MSGLTLWTTDKTVTPTDERRHQHKGPLLAPGLFEPPLASEIQFGPYRARGFDYSHGDPARRPARGGRAFRRERA